MKNKTNKIIGVIEENTIEDILVESKLMKQELELITKKYNASQDLLKKLYVIYPDVKEKLEEYEREEEKKREIKEAKKWNLILKTFLAYDLDKLDKEQLNDIGNSIKDFLFEYERYKGYQRQSIEVDVQKIRVLNELVLKKYFEKVNNN